MVDLDAYVDKYGKESVDQGIKEPVVDSEIIDDMKGSQITAESVVIIPTLMESFMNTTMH